MAHIRGNMRLLTHKQPLTLKMYTTTTSMYCYWVRFAMEKQNSFQRIKWYHGNNTHSSMQCEREVQGVDMQQPEPERRLYGAFLADGGRVVATRRHYQPG